MEPKKEKGERLREEDEGMEKKERGQAVCC